MAQNERERNSNSHPGECQLAGFQKYQLVDVGALGTESHSDANLARSALNMESHDPV
jgi:hypothetical protein